MASRQQSAVEYLTTYGWAIVAVGVMLGVLNSLGVFGLSASGATGCTVVEGFSCTQPVLYSSGALTMKIGEIGQAKIVTAVGCSKNSTAPTVWETTSIILQSGGIQNVTFICPWVQGGKLGQVFQGTLWIQYAAQSQSGTVTQAVGTVKIAVARTGLPGIPNGTSYVPITITNSQGAATPSTFQQMVQFSPSSYTQYEAADLGNIRFYLAGTALYSWCEANCSRAAGGKALFWVNLPGGIPAGGNVLVYMAFQTPNTLEYDGVYAGEAPQLSTSYGQYDNGGSVFGNYQNFAGTSSSLPNPWQCVTGQCSTANSLTYTENTVSQSGEIKLDGIQPNDTVLDLYMRVVDPSPVAPDRLYLFYPRGGSFAWFYTSGGFSSCNTQLCPSPSGPPPALSVNTWGVVSTASVNTTGSISYSFFGQLNYGSWSGPQTAPLDEYPYGYFYSTEYGSPNLQLQWTRTRAYPPGGSMPTVSLGAVTVSS